MLGAEIEDESEDESEESKEDVVENSSVISKRFKIKETSITLNTGDTGVTSYITDLINGHLECVIIKTESPISIKISLNDYEDIILFEDINIYETSYLLLRGSAMSGNRERFNYCAEKHALNDLIRIDVRSMANVQVNIILRWS